MKNINSAKGSIYAVSGQTLGELEDMNHYEELLNVHVACTTYNNLMYYSILLICFVVP